MSKRTSNKVLATQLCVSLHRERWPHVLDKLLDTLSEKRDSTRQHALVSLIQEFNKNVQLHDFVDHNYGTILYHCLNSINKGSSNEASLAARLLGLVSLKTVPGGLIAQEIRQESIPPIYEALKSDNFDSLTTYSSSVDCLAVITFLGGVENPEETEEAIKILCYLINSDDISDTPPSIIASVVYAFSLLLTTKDKVLINPEIWREPICFLLIVLDQEKDAKVWLAAAQALVLCFEIPSLNKFCPKGSNGEKFTRDNLKRKIVNKLRIMDAPYVYMFYEIIEFLDYNEISQGSSECTIRTWGEFLQMMFLKHFLGDSNGRSSFRSEIEYEKDEFVHDVECKPNPDFALRMTKTEKRLYKSQNSFGNKARTKVTKKKRGLLEDWSLDRCDWR